MAFKRSAIQILQTITEHNRCEKELEQTSKITYNYTGR